MILRLIHSNLIAERIVEHIYCINHSEYLFNCYLQNYEEWHGFEINVG